MAIVRPRRLVKFTTLDGSSSVAFPMARYHWQSTQGVRLADVQVIGADYAIDMIGSGVAPRDVGSEKATGRIHFDDPDDIQDKIDELRAECLRFGRGKLWVSDDDDVLWWAIARVTAIPPIDLDVENWMAPPFEVDFRRYSDWRAETATTVTETVTSTSEDISVVNGGTLDVSDAIITITANESGGFDGINITNLSNGDEFTIDQVAAGDGSVLKIDCGRHTVQYASDGETFVSAYGNFTWGDKQVDFMRLPKGTSTLRVVNDTTPNCDVEIEFYQAYI